MASPSCWILLVPFLLAPICIFSPRQQAQAADHVQTGADTLPRLEIRDIKTSSRQGQTILTFAVTLEAKSPLTMQVPILIRTGLGAVRFKRTVSAPRTDMTFALPDPPLEIVLDPAHELMRQPDPTELPPRWSRFLDAKEKTVVLDAPESLNTYAALLDYLQKLNAKITTTKEIKNADLQKTALLFLGADNAAARTLFARPTSPADGFTLDVRNNPLDQRHIAVLVTSSGIEETTAAVQCLPQYTDASYLHFKKGKIVKELKRDGIPGQHYTLEQLPEGAPVSAVLDFAGIIDRLADSRVVYVGETHTSAADHLLQLRIIQALFKNDPHLAIGMEMFPSSAQQALNEYIMGNSETNEKDFLKKSQYFQVWGYDWRLFRDIFNFARMNRIPVIGLNLDRKIAGNVFKTGSTDSLTPDQQQVLPADRDLDMPGYPDRLRQIHEAHGQEEGGHGTFGGFSGFIQAQGLWDETMAQNIAAYLAKNPITRMVVLAGVQHVRKDSGIPPRVARRIPVSQASVLNIMSDTAPADFVSIADFVFTAEPVSLPPAAKLGVVLEAEGEDNAKRVRITGLSPHGQAGSAGLRKNDILLAINGHPVYDMDDVRIALLDAEQGEIVLVRVRRGTDQEMDCQVTAHTPMRSTPHP